MGVKDNLNFGFAAYTTGGFGKVLLHSKPGFIFQRKHVLHIFQGTKM